MTNTLTLSFGSIQDVLTALNIMDMDAKHNVMDWGFHTCLGDAQHSLVSTDNAREWLWEGVEAEGLAFTREQYEAIFAQVVGDVKFLDVNYVP